MEPIEPSFLMIYADDILKFIFMFLVGGILVGIPNYLKKLPKDENVMWRYLISAFLMHGGLGAIAGVVLLLTPIENLLILGGLAGIMAHIGIEPIKKIAIKYAMKRLGVNGNGDSVNNGDKKCHLD